jgi:hypothetical protein
MATLRQTEIDEILNNDRTMNRRVLDRTIAQVQSFNDERSAPNVQDIKIEAIIGNLVDKLKASIAEALKLVALKQFPETNGSNAGIIMGLPAGEHGMTANDANQDELAELEEIQGVPYLDPATKRKVGQGITFDKEILRSNEKKERANLDNNQGYRYTAPLATSYDKRLNDDLEYLDDEEEGEGLDGGYCTGMGFGLRRRKRRMTGAGPNDGKPTMKSQAMKKSTEEKEQTVENALYDIINQYNAIVDKILTATDSRSVLKNKRLATASLSSYFANIVQGLIEPLKHLLYELSLVRDKDIASMFTMMKSLVDNIQAAPPFQKVDFRIYKTPITDYQRLNRDMRIDDYSGKMATVKENKTKIVGALKQLYKDASHIEYAMEDKTPEYKKEVKAHLLKKQKELREALKQADEDYKYLDERKKSGMPYDPKVMKDTTFKQKLVTDFLPVFDTVVQQAIPDDIEGLKRQLTAIEANAKSTKDIAETLYEKANKEVLTEQEVALLKSIGVYTGSAKKRVEDIKAKLSLLEQPSAVKKAFVQLFMIITALLLATSRTVNGAYEVMNAREEEEEAAAAEGEAGAEGAPAGAPPGVPGEGANPGAAGVGLDAEGKPRRKGKNKKMGYGRPLADLLAERKTQYNSMGRPLSDDDKIHKQVVKQNEKWQVSNPIHTTPIGSKNPFYAQQPDAKYDFRTKLGVENNKLYPKKNALGADVSLLQGAIGGPTEEAKQKRQYKKAEVETRTEAEALRNILNQNVYEGGAKKQPGALRKLVFDDDDNDLFDEEELPVNKGFIKEDKDDKFKLPDIKKEQAKKKKQHRL